jgi:hypothetical protein
VRERPLIGYAQAMCRATQSIIWASLLFSALWACEDTPPAGCIALGEQITHNQTLDDPQACVRCICAAGTLSCVPLDDCRATDAMAPQPDAHPTDAALERPDANPDAEPDAEPDLGPQCEDRDTRCLDQNTLLYCDTTQPAPSLQRVLCFEDERCIAGHCSPPLCAPNATICRLGRRVQCDAQGFPAQMIPCAEGQICAGGDCVEPQPEVLLLIDTSGSMESAVEPEDPRPFPICESPVEPFTRIGLVKRALLDLLNAPESLGLRLALLRFPQTASGNNICMAGHYTAEDGSLELGLGREGWLISGAHLDAHIGQMMAVPFPADRLRDDAHLAQWIDFNEVFTNQNTPCQGCEGLCRNNSCWDHDNPELRPVGNTPIGRSLFMAGEYFRHRVLREGQACVEASDCGATYYRCQDGRCHDPLGPCRTRTVILFTDGGESYDLAQDQFFYPPLQAKRLNMGVNCIGDNECIPPAVCHANQCRLGFCDTHPERTCGIDAHCPGAEPCRFGRLDLVTPTTDESLAPTHPDGSFARITVSVVDTGGHPLNQQTAFWGGGAYLPLETFSIEALIEAFQPLLIDAKERTIACLEHQ